MREVIKVLALCLVMALAFCVLRDIALAAMVVEYFSVARPKVSESASPVVLGVMWGLISSCWLGILLGIALSIAARASARPARTWRDLLPRVGKLFVYAALLTVIGWSIGSISVQREWYTLSGQVAELIEPRLQPRFVGAWWGSIAGEVVLVLGGLGLAIVTFFGRKHVEEKEAGQSTGE